MNVVETAKKQTSILHDSEMK